MQEPDLPLVFTRRDAVRLGLTDHAISWRAHTRRWLPLRRGVFVRADVHATATGAARHLLAALAVLAGHETTVVLSHLTAALAYGWAAPLDVDPTPWATRLPGGGAHTRRRCGYVRQVAPLPAYQVFEREGVTLTAPARTVADCLRHYPAETSVPIADSALAQGVDPREVQRILQQQSGWPYAARGAASARLLDGRREGWLESRSVVTIHRLGLPLPTPQVSVFDERGRFVGRVDLLWESLGVVGEPDGWAKYTLSDGQLTSLDRLRAEKQREDGLRSLGYEVVRWATADVLRPRPDLADRLARAFARADPARIRGRRAPRAWPSARTDVDAAGLRALRGLTGTGLLLLPPAPYSRSDGDLAC
jgi:hypothetical protein